MRVGKKRKLLTATGVRQLKGLMILGVSLPKAIERLELDVTRPTVAKLLQLHEKAMTDPSTLASLLPPWLDDAGSYIQEQPDNWYYEGFFPHGEWYIEDN